MKKIINKWQLEFRFEHAYEYLPKDGVYRLRVGIFKFKSLPPSGMWPSKKNIGKGFLWQFLIKAKIIKEI